MAKDAASQEVLRSLGGAPEPARISPRSSRVIAMKKTTRRELFTAVGFMAGVGVTSGYAGQALSEAGGGKDHALEWQYARLDPAAVAAEAYRLMPEGGCMYGAFRAILTAWFDKVGRSPDMFPFQMMRYGAGGIGGWGTICGALNAAAAVIGLFEPDKKQRERLIADLFSWYEHAELPIYQPPEVVPSKTTKSMAESVLCHVSVGRWCKASGLDSLSPELKLRCRCLTADVAAKTVELLNQIHSPKVGPEPATRKLKIPSDPRALGKMQCTTCHEQ